VKRTFCAAAFFLLFEASCSTQMSVTLIEAESPTPQGLDTYAVVLAWDGGGWDGSVPFTPGTVRLSPPRPPSAFDLEVQGWAAGEMTWRGTARNIPSDNLQPSVFFGKVNAFSSFAHTPDGGQDLAGSSASPLGHGQVLVIGGSSQDIEKLAWVYDHPSARFLTSPPPNREMAHHLALPLPLTDPEGDLEWLLAGGETADAVPTQHAEIYSRHYGGTPLDDLPVAQRLPVGNALDDAGGAAVGCGIDADGGAGLFFFTPGSGFEPTPPFGACSGGQLADLPDAGLVLLGLDGGIWLLADVGPQQIGELDVARGFQSVVYNGGVYVLGGVGPQGVTDEVRRVFPDPIGTATLAAARADFALLEIDSGVFLIVGGRDDAGQALAKAEILDLNGPASMTLPDMMHARITPALSDIPGCRAALVISGEDAQGQPAGGFEVFTYP
jgi:hypothetical protein